MYRKLDYIIKHSEVSEKMIEAYLVKRVKELGGVCLKYSNPGMVGYPDRVVLLPHGVSVWVELKSRGRKPSKTQTLRMEQLRALGCNVTVVDSREGVDNLLGGLEFLDVLRIVKR